MREERFSFYHVSSGFSEEQFFVTDMGMPGVLSVDHGSLFALHTDPVEGAFNFR